MGTLLLWIGLGANHLIGPLGLQLRMVEWSICGLVLVSFEIFKVLEWSLELGASIVACWDDGSLNGVVLVDVDAFKTF